MPVHKINNPDDALIGYSVSAGCTLTDFWRWAYSDLCDDDIKGVFAEWLVQKLLGVETTRRISWANSDVITKDCVRIEVKATSYWQSWKVIDESGKPYEQPLYEVSTADNNIRFGGLTAQDSTSISKGSTERKLKSHLYVFAFQHEMDISRWNAMDLSQWEFYLVRATELAKIAGRSVTLKKLKTKYGPYTAQEFVSRANEHIQALLREGVVSPDC